MNSLARFLLPAVAALFVVVALMGLSLWLMERPTTQAEIERLAERLADAAGTEAAPVEATDDISGRLDTSAGARGLCCRVGLPRQSGRVGQGLSRRS